MNLPNFVPKQRDYYLPKTSNSSTNESALYGQVKTSNNFSEKLLSWMPAWSSAFSHSALLWEFYWTSLGHLCPSWKPNVFAQILHLIELSVKSPCLDPVFEPAFTPYMLFQWYPQSKDILLSLGMKCWNSASNAQGSRLIIVVVQVRVMKIYVAAVEALRRVLVLRLSWRKSLMCSLWRKGHGHI